MPPYSSDPHSFPKPIDLSHHLSRSTKAREASSIKSFYKYFQIPGIAQLAGGTSMYRAALTRHTHADIRPKAYQTTNTSRTTRSKQRLHMQIDGNLRLINLSIHLPTILPPNWQMPRLQTSPRMSLLLPAWSYPMLQECQIPFA